MNKYLEKIAGQAFSAAMVGESCPDVVKDKYNRNTKMYSGLTESDILTWCRVVADKYKFNIVSLGRGLSTGTELEYSDSETIKNAFKNRA
jgi:hypothetical protein